VDALPLEPHFRVLEIGCGPGAAARAVAERLTTGHVLAIDRSPTAVAQATRAGGTRQPAARPCGAWPRRPLPVLACSSTAVTRCGSCRWTSRLTRRDSATRRGPLRAADPA
jgi:SAM-dependent methyltransferase